MSANDSTPHAHVASPLIDDDGSQYVSVGEIVAGKYRVERVLGVGGMAFVLAATHLELEERVALKFLNRDFLKKNAVTERFLREAKAACRIRSEHVARVYDIGMHKGAPFIVMEHLSGRDLATVLAERGALSVPEAALYMMQACDALAVAHSLGIVHRDIKPENLFLEEYEGLPCIKLLDFGISKIALSDGQDGLRLTGQLTLGTPCYMSPEQIRSTASADTQSDLWSLGAVLYELLTGAQAFNAATVTGVCAAVLEDEPRPIHAWRADVPDELERVVARCLTKDPAQRFANVADLAAALLPFAPPRAVGLAERCSLRLSAAPAGPEDAPSSLRPFSVRSTPRPASFISGAPLSRSIGIGHAGSASAAHPHAKSTWRRLTASMFLVAACAAAALLLVRPPGIAVMQRHRPAAQVAPQSAPAPRAKAVETPPDGPLRSPSSTAPGSDSEPLPDTNAVLSHRPKRPAAKPAPIRVAPRAPASAVAPSVPDAGPQAPPPAHSAAPIDLGY